MANQMAPGASERQVSHIESLVIGGGGFLGGALVRLLRASGLRPSVMVRQPAEDGEDGRISQGDVCDRESVRSVIRQANPSRVFHTASLIPAKAKRDIQAMFATNVMGALHVFEVLAKESPATLTVLCSSGAVYGENRGETLSESSPLHPVTVYGASKVAQEMGAVSYGAEHALPIVRVRPFNLVGPGEPEGLVSSAFCRQVAAAELELGPPVLAVGRLDSVRDFTDVRDVARACLLLSERGTPGEAYNICSGRPVAIAQVLDLVLHHARVPMSVKARQAIPPRSADVPHHTGTYEKLHRATGWAPGISLEESLVDLLNWWRERLAGGNV
ncbi:MAG: NAD-dependent epimerase/dehydratase family protein [Nitrospirae bacterium]|nr:NAD-dependent epimerase/dehydratase family protein [Nitrospirota bacterium]